MKTVAKEQPAIASDQIKVSGEPAPYDGGTAATAAGHAAAQQVFTASSRAPSRFRGLGYLIVITTHGPGCHVSAPADGLAAAWRGSGRTCAAECSGRPSRRRRRWPSAWARSRETCIWEMPSWWPICAWVMSP